MYLNNGQLASEKSSWYQMLFVFRNYHNSNKCYQCIWINGLLAGGKSNWYYQLPFVTMRIPMALSKAGVQYISIYFQAVRKVLTIEAKGEGEEVSLEIFILLWSCRSQYFSCQDLWSRDCEQDCQGIHGVLHYTVHATEKEFRLKARDGKEIWIKIHGCIFCFVQT